jgi:hypothetical protein
VRSRGAIAVILIGVLALVTALCMGIVTSCDTLVANVSRDNVCTTHRAECFVDERATMVSYDVDTDEVIVDAGGETVTLSAPTDLNDPPAPGTPVVLQRWEGGDVSWMIDLESGRRHGTSAFRSEAVGGLIICLIILFAVCARTFTWLRGY